MWGWFLIRCKKSNSSTLLLTDALYEAIPYLCQKISNLLLIDAIYEVDYLLLQKVIYYLPMLFMRLISNFYQQVIYYLLMLSMRLMPMPQYQFGGFTIQALRFSAIILK
jgi:hypothetical protein